MIPSDFASFIAPISEAAFEEDFFLKPDAMLLKRDWPGGLPFAFDRRDAEAAPVCLRMDYGKDFRVVRRNVTVPPAFLESTLARTEDWGEHLRSSGWSMVSNNLGRRFVPLATLQQLLERFLLRNVWINAYSTPAASQCFNLHSDAHHVFIWQQSGKKQWKVFRPGHDEPIVEHTLTSGDLLFIPEGFPHGAEACEDEGSMHLTIGLHSRRNHIGNVMMAKFAEWRDAAKANEENAEVIADLGSRESLLGEVDAFRDWLNNEWSPCVPEKPDVQLANEILTSLAALDESSVLTGSGDRIETVEIEDESGKGANVRTTSGKTFTFRNEFAEALQFLAANRDQSFQAGRLPGLSESTSEILSRVLLGAGLVTFSGSIPEIGG